MFGKEYFPREGETVEKEADILIIRLTNSSRGIKLQKIVSLYCHNYCIEIPNGN